MMDDKKAENRPHLKDTLLGLLVVCTIVLLVLVIIRFILNGTIDGITYIYQKLSKMDAVVVVALITGSCSIVAVCISTIVGNIIVARQSNREYLTKQREKPYEDFVEMIYRVQMSTRDGYEYCY